MESAFQILYYFVSNHWFRLESDGSDWAVKTLELLGKMSPTALTVTLRAVQKGAQQSLAECLKTEFRLVSTALTKDSDFYEGN